MDALRRNWTIITSLGSVVLATVALISSFVWTKAEIAYGLKTAEAERASLREQIRALPVALADHTAEPSHRDAAERMAGLRASIETYRAGLDAILASVDARLTRLERKIDDLPARIRAGTPPG